MKIELKCPCGAGAVFSDARGSFINPGGAKDDKGREFIIQVHADRWLGLHAECGRRKD